MVAGQVGNGTNDLLGFEISQIDPSDASTLSAIPIPDPAMKRVTEIIMDAQPVTAEDVADDIFDAVAKRRFMVITHKDARMQWRMKRMAPEFFYKMVRERVKPRFEMLKKAQQREQKADKE